MSKMLDFTELVQGDDFVHRFIFRDDAGVNVDVSVYVFSGQVRARAAGSAPLLADFLFIMSGDDGEIVDAHLLGADTAEFPRQVAWDIEVNLGGIVTTWFHNHEQRVQVEVTVP